MRRSILVRLILLGELASIAVAAAAEDAMAQETTLRVVPGVRVGPVTRHSSHSALRELLGDENVRVDTLEGEFRAIATVLYPADSLRRAVILWADTIALRSPETVIIQGFNSAWEFPLGLRLGITLDSLVQINGRPFEFAGFGWEAGGLVSPVGGRLASAGGEGLQVRLYLQPTCEENVGGLSEAEGRSLYGDSRVVASSNPLLRTLCVKMTQVTIDFRPGGATPRG